MVYNNPGDRIALFLALFISMKKVVIQPVNHIRLGVNDIKEGEGDLTMRLKANRKDEMGELTKEFNRFLDKLQEMIKDITHNVKATNTSSSDLSCISGHMSTGADNMSNKSNTVAVSAEEKSDSCSQVNLNTEELAKMAGQLDALVGRFKV